MTTASQSRVIALDGPSGSGKSTVARGVASRLGLRYVDTGATYRAATLAVLRRAADPGDEAAVLAAVQEAVIELRTDPTAPAVLLDGEDVSTEIRGPEVTAAVSAVSAIPELRARLVELQRACAGAGAVIEGRDIGTVVAADAPVKVFLDASAEVRAARRAGDVDAGIQLTAAGAPATGAAAAQAVVDAVAADLARRDRLDSSRAASPLQAAPDAVHLDSSALRADEVIERVLELAAAAGIAVPR